MNKNETAPKFSRETRKAATALGIRQKQLPGIWQKAQRSRMAAMSHIRAAFGTSLREAKDLVDRLAPNMTTAGSDAYLDPMTMTPLACLRDGLSLAEGVCGCWEKGDLASAVRALGLWTNAAKIVVSQNGGFEK